MTNTQNAQVIAFPTPEQLFAVEAQPMAVGAEDIPLPAALSQPAELGRPALYLVQAELEPDIAEVIPLHPIKPVEFKQLCIANAEILDGSAEIMTEMAEAHARAETIIEANRQLLRDGQFERVPLDVDGLGTAAKVLEARRLYGEGSEEYKQAERALLMDCGRKLDEAETKIGPSYFEAIVYDYVPEQDTVYADGLPYEEIAINGLSPIGHAEETARRPHDFAASILDKTLVKRPGSERVGRLHTSRCPRYAIEAYKRDPKGAHNGYALEDEKQMIDFGTYDPKRHRFYHEQVGIPGKRYITREVINKGYQRLELIGQDEMLDDAELYGVQGIVDRREINEVLDFVALLDEIASQESGFNIFMGELVPADRPKDYQAIKEQARLDRQTRQVRTRQLADYTLELEERGTEHALGTVMQNIFIKDLLLDAAKEDTELAARAFDEETAIGFKEAQNLRAQGRDQEAQDKEDATRQRAPDPGGCGAGSCGLESLKQDNQRDKVAEARLKPKANERLVKDTLRKCGECGGDVYYAYSKKHVRKLCIDCDAYEVDGKLLRSGDKKKGKTD